MKRLLLLFCLLFAGIASRGQNYNNILNYYNNGTPTYGVKIKTNLPFAPGGHMPTIQILGYSYGTNEPVNLTLTYYLWGVSGTPSSYYVYSSKISSSGGYTPAVYLSNESGKVVIFIDDKVYYQRFTVSVYSNGDSEQPSWFTGWTGADEALSGTQTAEVPYSNRFKGNVAMPGDGIWNASGNVGIGTATPAERLSVNGNIRAKQVKVETASWPDYVFAEDYPLSSLAETEKQIREQGHLPGIPSAAQVKAQGVDLGGMSALLLQKIEELTLHLIELKKENQAQRQDIRALQSKLKPQQR